MKARGGTKVNLLIGLLVTAALIVGALRVVPVYIRSYEYKDYMRTQAKFAGVENKPPDAVRDALYRKANDLELPIRREQIRVGPGPGGVRITTQFTVPLDLVVYQTSLSFNFSEDTRSAY